MSILHRSRIDRERELEEIRSQMERMQYQIDALVTYFARFPQPARPGWERHSSPDWDTNPQTKILPIPPGPAVLPRRIMRVTLCMSGGQQWVNAYDIDGERIPEFCGLFRDVGRKIIAREPRLKWETIETVAESA